MVGLVAIRSNAAWKAALTFSIFFTDISTSRVAHFGTPQTIARLWSSLRFPTVAIENSLAFCLNRVSNLLTSCVIVYFIIPLTLDRQNRPLKVGYGATRTPVRLSRLVLIVLDSRKSTSAKRSPYPNVFRCCTVGRYSYRWTPVFFLPTRPATQQFWQGSIVQGLTCVSLAPSFSSYLRDRSKQTVRIRIQVLGRETDLWDDNCCCR